MLALNTNLGLNNFTHESSEKQTGLSFFLLKSLSSWSVAVLVKRSFTFRAACKMFSCRVTKAWTRDLLAKKTRTYTCWVKGPRKNCGKTAENVWLWIFYNNWEKDVACNATQRKTTSWKLGKFFAPFQWTETGVFENADRDISNNIFGELIGFKQKKSDFTNCHAYEILPWLSLWLIRWLFFGVTVKIKSTSILL